MFLYATIELRMDIAEIKQPALVIAAVAVMVLGVIATSHDVQQLLSASKTVESADVPTTTITQVPNAYTVADVSTVSAVYIDPEPMMADEEYTEYVITLENGTVHTVQVGFMPMEMIAQRFSDTGFVGSYQDLIALVQE